ncbi:flagellin [Limnohabitans sp.]|uniref:flagellin N-terminal helical domain-containing protein n=1 Tax=Limnohabitans sp. TaxID=1907725 RepID=UPI0038BA9F42
MAVINTNVKALFSQAALTTSGRSQALAMQQLSTGKRINSARDDAAGMAIATRMTQQIRGLNQAVRNSGDAINLIQTAEGATNEITDMMQRMRELAVQAVNDTNDNAQRSYLDLEFQQLKQQIVQIADNTEWNGFPVLNGSAGQRVGEMPVYKVTSENQFGNVFINPTTSRTVAGSDAGETQTLQIAGAMPALVSPQTLTISVGGVDVVLDQASVASAATVATKIQQAMSNDSKFNSSSGRSVTVSGDTLTINYAPADGNVADTSFDPQAAVGLTATIASTREAIVQGAESFKGNGTFLFSGALSMSVDTSGNVTASFETAQGTTIPMQGIMNNTAVTESTAVTFSAMTAGQTLTLGGLTYTAGATGATAAEVATDFASRANGYTAGTLPLPVKGVFTGALSGFDSGAATAVDVTFTSATSGTNVTNLAISGSGALPTAVVTDGAPAGSITFIKSTGTNSQVLSDDLVYAFQKSDGTNAPLTGRAFSYNVSVEGSIPALRAGDLKINGIDIGASYATDDKFSPVANAAGSAIAKAAAINRLAVATGVTQGETQMLTFAGTPSPGNITVAGVSVTLNALDTTSAAATAKIAAALQASPLFAPGTGRVVTYAPGNSNLSIKFATTEGNMPDTVIQTGATGLTGLVDTTAENYIASTGTGVFAKVNENVMSGRAMSGTSVLKGTVFINGFASADITTVLNNSRETRANVVRAINLISDKTGVKAVDTGSDAKGITLSAADGRNIEVTFDTSANADDFGSRIGMRQGVQASTISLESKIPAPVVLTSDTTGDITRAGLMSGNFSKNEAVANTSPRVIVGPNVAQVESVTFSGTAPADGDTFKLTVNGTPFTYTANVADGLTAQAVRDGLVALVNADAHLPVTAIAGRNGGEILLTSDNPGTAFTLSNSKSNTTTTVNATSLQANAKANSKPLGTDDLVINGVKIPPSTNADDKDSNRVASSSDPAASAIAIAKAINSQTPLTGVTAKANGAEIKGLKTDTSLPILASPTLESLFINGTEVKVQFVQDETKLDRLTKVAEAINARAGEHGVTAVITAEGISLKSDGRNLSVWFDSNVKDLSAANFGLDQGGAVAQSSQISFSGTSFSATDTASVTINGVQITSDVSGAGTDVALAAALETAITAAINSGAIKNVSVTNTAGVLSITSTVAGTAFDIAGAATNSATTNLAINEVKANSFGNNQITGIFNATATSNSARTVYGTVRMVALPPQLPGLPKPIGAPPSDMDQLLLANARPFTVSTGSDGFNANSNFSSLGFNEGSFGGRSSSEMDPPRVGRLAFQVGSSANQTVTIDLADFGKNGPITGEITGDVDQNIDQRTVRINTRDGATDVLTKLDSAMDKINATRATMGAVMNRLDHVINNLTNVSMNLSTSRSGIEDADYASSSTELAKTQIMQQAATAVLAQANTSQQTVLKLLGG